MKRLRSLRWVIGLDRGVHSGVAVAVLLFLATTLAIPQAEAVVQHSVSVSALPLEYVGRDPGGVPEAEVHANISYVSAAEMSTRPQFANASVGTTPFQFTAEEGSYLSFCVAFSPNGWGFVRMWGVRVGNNYGYFHFPRHNEDCLLNQRVAGDLKVVVFFTQQALLHGSISAHHPQGYNPVTVRFHPPPVPHSPSNSASDIGLGILTPFQMNELPTYRLPCQIAGNQDIRLYSHGHVYQNSPKVWSAGSVKS